MSATLPSFTVPQLLGDHKLCFVHDLVVKVVIVMLCHTVLAVVRPTWGFSSILTWKYDIKRTFPDVKVHPNFFPLIFTGIVYWEYWDGLAVISDVLSAPLWIDNVIYHRNRWNCRQGLGVCHLAILQLKWSPKYLSTVMDPLHDWRYTSLQTS